MSGFVFSEKPIELERGDGVYLYDTAGTEYLDAGASYACVPLGHGHEAVRDAITDQLSKLTYVQGSYPVAARTALYETLADVAPGDLDDVWLCNSGTEANEAALKFARHATGNTKVVAAMQGFHGRTMGSLSATWKTEYRSGFEPLASDFEFVPYGDDEALAEAVDEETAAVVLEPIQGEGGVNPAPEGYLAAAREACDEVGAALVLDEIQTGLGRTGSMWACQDADGGAGVVPDVLTTAKGLANGLPMGATVVADWIAEDPGSHGGTFSGNPVVSAAAGATLDALREEDLVENAAVVGEYLRTSLADELGDDVREVRGDGLMIAIEGKRGANRAARDLAVDHGVLAIPTGRTALRLLPPLCLTEDQADDLVAAVGEVAEVLTV